MVNKVFDTNVLLDNLRLIEDSEDRSRICISWTVLKELDGLKNRTYKARETIRQISKYKDEITFIGVTEEESNDDIILRDAEDLLDSTLITNDELLFVKAHLKGLAVEKFINKGNELNIYENPRVVKYSDREVARFYSKGDLVKDLDSPYMVAVTEDCVPFAAFKRDHGVTVEMSVNNFSEDCLSSKSLGSVTPKDIYQKMAVDSLKNNQMTILTGAAGTGKTFLSLAYILSALQSGDYSRVVIFTNPVKVRDTVDLGSYTGDRGEKLLQQSIGTMLSSKLGDMMGIEYLMGSGKLAIYPFSDIRGVEIKEDEILYLPEMQNSSIDLAKLAVQRVSDGAKIIAEGDMEAQVDMTQFEGSNNGLRRYIEVLNGRPGVAHIDLPNNYRSEISSWADDM